MSADPAATVDIDRVLFAWKEGQRDVIDIARFAVESGPVYDNFACGPLTDGSR